MWDKGLDYDEFLREVKRNIKELLPPETELEEKKLTYWTVIAIQLTNGLRISEAIEATKKWAKSGKTVLEVKVRKKRRKQEIRPVKIPKFVIKTREYIQDVLREKDEKLERRIVSWASKHKINTHSVRYAWVTKKLKEGVNPAIVAGALRHSKLDMLMKYVQRMEADKLVLNEEE